TTLIRPAGDWWPCDGRAVGDVLRSAMAARDGNFLPRMHSQSHGFTVVDDLVWRGWGGIVADIWRVRCAPDAHGSYVSPDPRLFVVLDITPGGRFELTAGNGAVGVHRNRWSMAYVP